MRSAAIAIMISVAFYLLVVTGWVLNAMQRAAELKKTQDKP